MCSCAAKRNVFEGFKGFILKKSGGTGLKHLQLQRKVYLHYCLQCTPKKSKTDHFSDLEKFKAFSSLLGYDPYCYLLPTLGTHQIKKICLISTKSVFFLFPIIESAFICFYFKCALNNDIVWLFLSVGKR